MFSLASISGPPTAYPVLGQGSKVMELFTVVCLSKPTQLPTQNGGDLTLCQVYVNRVAQPPPGISGI